MKRKAIRTRGKFSLSRFFSDITEGSSVAVVRERSLCCNFPKRIQGRTGKVMGKRGSSCIIKINDQSKEKLFIIKPVHLKKIK